MWKVAGYGVLAQHIANSDVGPFIMAQLWLVAISLRVPAALKLNVPKTCGVFTGVVVFIPAFVPFILQILKILLCLSANHVL